MTALRIVISALLVVLITALTTVAAYLFSQTQPERYRANTQISLDAQTQGLAAIGFARFRSSDDAERESANEVLQIASFDVARDVASADKRYTADAVASNVFVTNETGSDVITITAEGPSPQEAARLATVYRDQYAQRERALVRRQAEDAQDSLNDALAVLSTVSRKGPRGSALRDQLAALEVVARTQGDVAIVQEVRAFSTAVSPQTKRNVLFGMAFGLLIGIGMVALRGATRERKVYPAPPPD